MWISNAERPLQADELRHDLGVKIGSTDLDPEKVPAIQTLLGCALGLLTFEKASSTVRLFSYTLQEYLLNNQTLLQSPHPRPRRPTSPTPVFKTSEIFGQHLTQPHQQP
ncbi:hypothetical protein L873DRAFT_1822777, partial [Choiromyces venosus 120613-1]